MLPKRLSRLNVVRYSAGDHNLFIKQIAENPNDRTVRGVFADYLEDNAPELATPTVLDRLRNYEHRLWVGLSPKGMVHAIPTAGRHVNASHFYHATSRNSKGRAHGVRASGRMKTWVRDPDRFQIPYKFGLYDNGYINNSNAHQFLTEDPTEEPT